MLDSPTAPRCFSSLMEVNIEIDASKIEEMTVADTAVEFGQEPMESDETVFQKADANYNHILRMLGSPGRYQILLLILLGIGTMSATISDFVSIFYTIPPKATYCKIPEQHTKNGLIPLCYHQLNRTMEKSGVGSEFLYVKLDSEFCRIMPTGDPSEMSQEEAGCRGWPCDYEILHNFTYPRQWTVIAQYELSCSSYWMFTFSLVLYFAGAFVGTIMMEMFAKKLGYKLNMFARFAFYIVLCVGIGLEKVLWLFVLLRFLLGALAHVYLLVCRLFGTEDYKKIIEETP